MNTFVDFGKKSSKLAGNLIKNERRFSAGKYSGRLFGKPVGEVRGTSNVAVLALNSTVVEEDGSTKQEACKYTGALAEILSYETGCRGVFLQKKISSKNRAQCLDQLAEKLAGIDFLIVLRNHECTEKNACSVRASIEGKPDRKRFLEQLTQYLFEFTFDNYVNCVAAEEFTPGAMLGELFGRLSDCRQTGHPASDEADQKSDDLSEITTVCIDFDLDDFNNDQKKYYLAIKRLIVALTNMDWQSERMGVYRLWQADGRDQIPQDKVEFSFFTENGSPALFRENSFLHLRSFYDVHETVRARSVSGRTLTKLKEFLRSKGIEEKPEQFAVLTNRMIENLYGREWIEDLEETPGLFGAPVIVYENEQESYVVGIPKANQVNDVSLSTLLYREKFPLSDKYDYMIFNRFSDSRMFIDAANSDYKDNGRVPEKRVMLPRYYRLMMGYAERPLRTIREEVYLDLYKNLDEQQKTDFDRCYKKIPRQAYYQLVVPDEKKDGDVNEYKESLERVTQHLESLGVFRLVNLIRMPKQKKPDKRRYTPGQFYKKAKMWVLEKSIGKAEYLLKTNWAEDTDDKNSVARLNSNMMNLIGVSENDKILIRFGKAAITLRVLIKDELTDYEIGIPASGRRDLGMNSMNDIVIVHRDMEHTFTRHSQEQTIAILGTVLAAAQIMTATSFFTSTWWGILLGILICFIAIVLMLYFALGEERVKVK